MNSPQLIIEVLNGPLDGARIVVQADTEWRRIGVSPLAFPWDAGLGEPQACLFFDGIAWKIEGYIAQRRTHLLRVGQDFIVSQPAISLEKHDIFKASNT